MITASAHAATRGMQLQSPEFLIGNMVRFLPLHGLLTLLCAVLFGAAQAAQRLPALNAQLPSTTVSGISAGGYMAVQFHVAHSAIVSGAGVLAAGPYYCAQGSLWTARYNCMRPRAWTPIPPTSLLKSETDALANSGQIDATSHLRRARVWLFSGSKDKVVKPQVVQALQRYYAEYVPPASMQLVTGIKAGHAMVTDDFGSQCDVTAAPFINDCDFDAAGALLQYLYGPLQAPSGSQSGELLAFDQSEFANGHPDALSLAQTGYAYIPLACRTAACRVHIAFHGCKQSEEAVGLAFVQHAGYNRWADANRIIVLYPQTIARYGWAGSFVFNPNGCWDWWGYTSALYHTRDGPQIRVVKAMLDRLAQPR
jgi:poly(3-hydroxybutyrate) depolymerase